MFPYKQGIPLTELKGKNMNRKNLKGSLLLLLTSVIWGVGFVAQRAGGDIFRPYSFNGIRFVIAGFVLLPLVVLIRKKDRTIYMKESLPSIMPSIRAGVICGFFLAVASTLQQLGITIGGSAGKASFLTACYIVIVPVLGVFLGKKCPLRVWLAVFITLGGLYLLCAGESFALSPADILLLSCAFCFAVQILFIDFLVSDTEPILFSCAEFFTAGFLGCVPAFFFEFLPDTGAWFSMFSNPAGWLPLIYAAVFSSAGGYTLQIVGQKYVHPAIASLLMSLESVFGVLSAWLILGERLSAREISGCAMIFAAVILAQLPKRRP